MLPGLREHSCSRGRRGGFLERLNEGTWLGHVAEHVALALQQLVGHDIRRGKTRQVKGEPGRYNIIYGYIDENVGLSAGRLAITPRQPPRRGRPGLRLGDRARRVHPPRRAHRVRPLHAGDRRRGRLARHPVDPAQPVLPRPARPGRPRQADPRDDDVRDVVDRRRHRLRQGPHHQAARRRRAARCPSRSRCARRTPPSRPPAGSATPSCSSRSTATTAAGSASTCRTRTTYALRSRSRRASRAAATSSSSRS